MKKISLLLYIVGCLCFITTDLWAGNKDRVGSAGATELLYNPWARSSGMHSIYTAGVKGIEAMRMNVGGLAFTRRTEVAFAHTQWLRGSGVSMNALGFAQKIGETSVLGVNLVAMDFGDIEVTTGDRPEGTGATYQPQFFQLGLAYARSFSESIHGGAVLRLVQESIPDASASGIAFDVGIQYVTGPNNNAHFGIALRNVGTPMTFNGDGLQVTLTEELNGGSLVQIAEKFELPTMLNIGVGYDFRFGDDVRLTAAGNFTSHSFRKDQIGVGLEFAFAEKFMLRGGFNYEDGIMDDLDRTTAFTGLALGATIEVPLKKGGPAIGVDYSFRATETWDHTHTIGLKINL